MARRVRRLIIALGVLGICGMVGEGAAGDWSAVYLKDNLGTSAGFAALAFAAFSVTMTAGRAVGDGLIRRFGTVPVIRCCGLLAASGLTGALVSRNPGAAIGGFVLSARTALSSSVFQSMRTSVTGPRGLSRTNCMPRREMSRIRARQVLPAWPGSEMMAG